MDNAVSSLPESFAPHGVGQVFSRPGPFKVDHKTKIQTSCVLREGPGPAVMDLGDEPMVSSDPRTRFSPMLLRVYTLTSAHGSQHAGPERALMDTWR